MKIQTTLGKISGSLDTCSTTGHSSHAFSAYLVIYVSINKNHINAQLFYKLGILYTSEHRGLEIRLLGFSLLEKALLVMFAEDVYGCIFNMYNKNKIIF